MDLAERRGLETDVYQPAEDSHLLLDAARDHVGDDDVVLEVGTGSGYVATELEAQGASRVVASDVNPLACQAAKERGLEVVLANLVEPFAADSFDVVLFNPPYLPETEETTIEDWMDVALTGGETGRGVIDPFIESVGRVLALDGMVLLIASSLSGLDDVEASAEAAGFRTRTVVQESFPFETIEVLALTR